ncbi:hypothetical protein, partial [Legionella norrlandica]|uniref:hypothetical protein n=1 Tax=Legionella norrlandica TaxID=1498499 RepID=UPI000569BDCD
PEQREHVERGIEIDNHHNEEFLHNMRKWGKTVKNERKTATGFRKEAEEEAQKGSEADPKKVVYGEAGYLAHTIFGSIKAGMNPWVSNEDILDCGAMIEYITDYNPTVNK